MDCPHCKVFHEEAIFKDNLMVCPECGHHLRMEPRDRIAYLADEGSFKEINKGLKSCNPIEMEGYEEKISQAQMKTNRYSGSSVTRCQIFAVFSGSFLSMRIALPRI